MLINKAHVRKFALEVSLTKRGGKFRRVSKEFLDRIECKVREAVRREIEMAPSVGVTLK